MAKVAKPLTKMRFDEALTRFIQTKPLEVEQLIAKAKKRNPPGSQKKPSGGKRSTAKALKGVKRKRKH